MGRKCGVEGCLSDSNRPEDTGVTFHKVPVNADVRPKWISLCRIPEDKKNMKVIYICSRHFLRMDFCNFKGKKYMLRQGVLPSVFPWDKSKLEAIKSTTKVEPEKTPVKQDVEPENKSIESTCVKEKLTELKEEVLDAATSKEEIEEEKEKIKTNANGPINFSINSRIEALDNNNTWYPARIVEEDYEENEVLIHFEKSSNKHDEWICMDSPRLRPLQLTSPEATSSGVKKGQVAEQYVVGERCLASWSDARKFPATVTKVLENDTYEVLFDDGFVKNLKAHRMCKAEGRPMQSSPLFDPIQSSKQERRDKKRKINIAELFGKRQRLESSEEKPKTQSPSTPLPTAVISADEILEPWVPQWEGGRPIGIESSIEAHDGTRKSIIVPDPRLPEGWVKHLAQRAHGASAGKWDTIIVSPDNRRFRSRAEVKTYLEETKLMKYNWSMFDFSVHRHRNRKRDFEETPTRVSHEPPAESFEQEDNSELITEEEETKNCLKIPIVDDAYQCPIEGCGKTYRKENLAQMHVKHYHPEYTKFLDSTPNVADLAYARTVGESLDKSPTVKTPVAKPVQKSATLRSASKSSQSPQLDPDSKPQSPLPLKNKDSEIIKLLNTKPFDGKKDPEAIKPLPAGLPSSMYPDFKLKDLLNKSEGIPNRDDLNLRALSSTRPPTGIKTLLPVVRVEKKENQQPPEIDGNRVRSSLKRKRGLIDYVDSPKGNEPRENTYIPQDTPPLPEPNDVIIEGGQVIKIVRMKQEEIINCTCGYPEEDGLMIQCDLCLCWQHAFCNNIERESQVPEKYVCCICQNPAKQRMSKKYYHDQDWLKHGVLATTNFHTKDEELLSKRFEKLKKSHDISGGLLEVREFVNSLKVKLKIAEAKNHPKLYLWSKPWEKLPLPEKMGVKVEETKPNIEKMEEDIKNDNAAKVESSDSMLMMILKGTKEEVDDNLNCLQAPAAPQPEAAIDSADCRLNLLEHIAHSQSLVEERLDDFEKQINDLEDASFYEDGQDYPRTRQTLNMLLRDLNTLQELSQLTTL